jgi:xylulose-5-phosphate/fructose-6-phosphate phosphoketolase
VRGYKEEGTTTTPFDMAVRNQIDRFDLMFDAVDRVSRFAHLASHIKQLVRDKLIDHREYIERVGDDMPEIRNWTWRGTRPGS